MTAIEPDAPLEWWQLATNPSCVTWCESEHVPLEFAYGSLSCSTATASGVGWRVRALACTYAGKSPQEFDYEAQVSVDGGDVPTAEVDAFLAGVRAAAELCRTAWA